MEKCKVVAIFEMSWGTVAILDFLGPTYFKVGDKLKNLNGLLWIIVQIRRGKPVVEAYENLMNSIYVWECTVKPLNHTQVPSIEEELSLVKY